MESRQQSNHETCHAILLGQKGLDLLLVPTTAGFRLPSVEIPRRRRLAESLTAAMRTKWGCEAICLFSPEIAPPEIQPEQGIFIVLELCHLTEAQDAQAVWVPTGSLSPQSFADSSDYAVVQRSLAGCGVVAGIPMPGPFAAVGWFEQLFEWVKEASHPLKLQPNGRFRQLNASPSFSLIRFETNGPALWFKAVGGANLKEFSITLTLARLFPAYLPHAFACRPEWNGWLTVEAQGINLEEARETKLWKLAARSLANLQIEALDTQPQLLTSGVLDFRRSTLLGGLPQWLELMTQLSEHQCEIPSFGLGRSDVLRIGEQIQDALFAIAELGVPDSLGHLDLNPSNMIVSSEACTFLDWAEGYMGPPFLSFEYLLQHFRRAFGRHPVLEAELRTIYMEPWQALCSRHDIETALRFVPMLAVFAYATAISGAQTGDQDGCGPEAARYLGSLGRRLKREADSLVVGRDNA